MTPEQKAAHMRMLSTLPSKIHIVEAWLPGEDGRKNLVMGYVRGQNPKQKRPVIINGVRYQSLRAASDSFGISRQLLHQWILRGDRGASYAE